MSELEKAARLALDTLERTAIRLTQGDFVLPAINALRAALEQAEPVVDREAISRALGGDAYWMNPPDGGSVTLFEQVARANKAGREREKYVSILARAYDAIEALDGTSLENEKLVDDYRAALAQQQAEPVDKALTKTEPLVDKEQAEPVAEPHQLATSADSGQFMTQADSGNPSF